MSVSREVKSFIVSLFGDFYRVISRDERSSPFEALTVLRMMVSMAPLDYQPLLLMRMEGAKGYIANEANALDTTGKEEIQEYLGKCKNELYTLFSTIVAAYQAGGMFAEESKAARVE